MKFKTVAWAIPIVGLGSAGLLGLTGCEALTRLGWGTTPIKDVVNNPSQYSTVTVRGNVTNQAGVLGVGAYELKDDSGAIWIVTNQGLPPLQTTVTVRGAAKEGVTIGGLRLGVTLTEEKRL